MPTTDPIAGKSIKPVVEDHSPTITPVFPLLLLETMRDMDRPDEFMEDEDVAISLPRRLGLSEVVSVQIRRFQNEVRLKRLQGVSQVEDLIRLVIRRPDADEIFDEAGRRVARQAWDQRSGILRGLIKLMPRPVALFAAQRAARRIFARVVGRSRFSISRWPLELHIRQSLTAQADPGGAACAFYSGVFRQVLEQYTGRRYRIQHASCETRGDEQCLWTVQIAA